MFDLGKGSFGGGGGGLLLEVDLLPVLLFEEEEGLLLLFDSLLEGLLREARAEVEPLVLLLEEAKQKK